MPAPAAFAPRGHNQTMRRRTQFGIAAVAVLVVLLSAYSAYWLVVARRIENGIALWASSARERRLDASWHRFGVAGFPLRFQIALKGGVLRDRSVDPAPELRVPMLSGSAAPWNLDDWRLSAPAGLAARLDGSSSRPPLQVSAPSGEGVLHLGAAGGGALWLRLPDARVGGSARLRVGAADIWVTLPPRPAHGHTEPNFGIALDLRAIELPAASWTLGDRLEQLAFGMTVKGVLPSGNLAHSVEAWRDAGGTIELDNLDLRWAGLGATATGTIALDQDLQPIGAFSGAVEGYDRVLRALVQVGRLRAGDAGLAQLVLTMLAKTGPHGRPQVTTSFTIQNGQMYLGPAKLGPAPRLAWK
jgi:hypothetical protein